jgi:hypothetical protein
MSIGRLTDGIYKNRESSEPCARGQAAKENEASPEYFENTVPLQTVEVVLT